MAGEVNDLFGGPIASVHCIVRTYTGAAVVTETDAQGFFLLDGLPEAPSFIEFEGARVVTETRALVRPPQGEASRVFMVLAREQGDAQVPAPNRR